MKSLLFTLLTLSAPALAQVELEGLTLDDLIVRKVVTASRREEDSSMAPATIRVITQKEIEDRGYKDLKDIFRDLPGFDVSENVPGEARTMAMARGILGENKLLVLRDGKRINATTGERLVLGNNMPLFNAKRIEVMYGPGSVLYGADAYAGVVNIITKSLSDLKKEAKGRGGLANVSYGLNNTIDTGVMGGGKLAEQIDTLWSLRYYLSDGIDPTNFPEFDAYTLGYSQPVDDYEIYGRTRIGAAQLTFYRQDAKEPGGPGTAVNLFEFSDSYVWHQTQNKLYLDHSAKGEKWELTSTLGYEDYEINPQSNFNYVGFPAYKYGRNSAVYWEGKLDYRFNEKTSLVSGVLVERVNAFAKGNNLASPFNRADQVDEITYPNDGEIPVEYRNRTVQFGMMPYTSSGIFSEVKHKFSDNLLANLGARYDYNTDYFGVFTPRAGLVWKASPTTTTKLLYGEAYIKPSRYLAFEHWRADPAPGVTFGYYPNPDLKPEQLRTVQFNIQHQGSKYFAVTLNTFMNFVENLITPSNDGDWNENINQGSQKTRGAELVMDYQPSARMRAYLNYSYLDAKRGDGSPMNKVADQKIQSGFTYQWSRLSITPSIRWSDHVHFLDTTQANGIGELNDFMTIDLALRWRNVVKFGDLYMTVRNVLDKEYYAANPFGEGPEGWLMSAAPQPGRTGELGFSYRF